MPISGRSDRPDHGAPGAATPRRVETDRNGEPAPGDIRLTRIGSGSRGLVAMVATVVALVALLVAKPWAEEPGSPSSDPRADAMRRAGVETSAPPSPSPEPSLGPDAVACLVQRSWRLVTFQRDGTAEQRTWYAAHPLPAARGPDDPGIPIRRAVTHPLTAIGFCAPTLGPDGAPLDVTGARFWRIDANGRPARLQGVRRLSGSLGPDAARLYAYPPIVGTPRAWPPGTYVMAIETTGTPWWLGIRIEDQPD